MKILIFEDEKHTASRLVQLLHKFNPGIEVLAVIGSVQEGIMWYKNNPAPDLVFQDILLNDGNCFEIFEKVKINVPIIFTTAYNEFALQSFKVNSIDYVVSSAGKRITQGYPFYPKTTGEKTISDQDR